MHARLPLRHGATRTASLTASPASHTAAARSRYPEDHDADALREADLKRHAASLERHTTGPCPAAKDFLAGALDSSTRQFGWVVVSHDVVRKHMDPNIWDRELRITLLLSRFPGFVKVLWFDARCRIMGLERLRQGQKPFEKLINWNRKAKASRGPRPVSAHAERDVARQVDHIFSVLKLVRVVPSTEILLGWPSNVFIGPARNVTVYDFGGYCYCPEGDPAFDCDTEIDILHEKLRGTLFEGFTYETPVTCATEQGACRRCPEKTRRQEAKYDEITERRAPHVVFDRVRTELAKLDRERARLLAILAFDNKTRH
eukprot:g5558.t1